MNLDNLNKEIVDDPLTGDKQTIYWNNEGTFMMCIPHKGIQLPKEYVAPKYKITDNGDGTKTWELTDKK